MEAESGAGARGFRPAFLESKPLFDLQLVEVDEGDVVEYVVENGTLESGSNTIVRCEVEARRPAPWAARPPREARGKAAAAARDQGKERAGRAPRPAARAAAAGRWFGRQQRSDDHPIEKQKQQQVEERQLQVRIVLEKLFERIIGGKRVDLVEQQLSSGSSGSSGSSSSSGSGSSGSSSGSSSSSSTSGGGTTASSKPVIRSFSLHRHSPRAAPSRHQEHNDHHGQVRIDRSGRWLAVVVEIAVAAVDVVVVAADAVDAAAAAG